MENNLTKLTTDDNNREITKESFVNLDNSKQKIKKICNQILSLQNNNFDLIINSIKEYLALPENKKRILYSEISNFIFEITDAKCGSFLTNLDMLLGFVLSKEGSDYAEISKIIIKISDHCNLAEKQKSMSQKITTDMATAVSNTINGEFDKKLEQHSNKVKEELQHKEREYITILGIFASIVLAFVGGVTFSSSVLQNIHKVNFYRLIIIVDLIGFICFNMIYALTYFIRRINKLDIDGKGKPKKELGKMFYIINIVLLLILVAIIFIWLVMPCLFINL